MALAEDVKLLLRDTGEVLASLVEGASASPSSRTDAALPQLFRSFESVKQRCDESSTTVAVLALAKSGKSTLINALLGDAVLPSNNVPETARITSVQHAPSDAPPRLAYQCPGNTSNAGSGGVVVVEGVQAIRSHLRHLNITARSGSHGSLAAGEQLLQITMPVAALADMPAGQLGAGNVVILDTPGPNEAGEDHLRYKVERLLESVDAVVYLLDYTKLKTNEETSMLQRLHDINPSLIRRLCHRLFFVVNKMDVAECCEGLDEQETRDYVADLVTKQLNVPGFELQPDQIYLVSARDALRSRMVLRGDVSSAELDAFRKVAFGKRWKMVEDPETIRETALEMLQGSGLLEMESGVLGFLSSRAAVLHMVAILDDLERLLAQVNNLTRASAASLHQGVAALSARVSALQTRLSDTLGQFEGLRGEVQQLEGLVVDEVRERMGRLRSKLVDQITQVLTPSQLPATVPHGRWPAVWVMAKNILRLGRRTTRHAPDLEGAEGEQELQDKLAELHSLIYVQIESEVKEFWHSMEQSANQRQRRLFAAINERVCQLSREIEAEVSCTLMCAIEPVDMRLKRPTAEQFHVNLKELLKRGIQKEVTQELREVTEERTVFRPRRGLCKSDWWEPEIESHTETVSVEHTRYQADVAGIRTYFLEVVDSTIENSVRAVRGYVHTYLSDRLEEARSSLKQYADRYSAVMMDSLETTRQGEAERAAALSVAELHCEACSDLLERVHELQQQAEEMLEGWEDELEATADEPPSLMYASYASCCSSIPGGGNGQEDESTAGQGSGSGGSASAAAAASTVAALADLQNGRASAWLEASEPSVGSSAADVAAAYAAQQVDELAHMVAELDTGGAGTGGQDQQQEQQQGEEGQEEEGAAEVPLLEDNSSPRRAAGTHAAEPGADLEAEAAAAALGGSAEEDDWTVVSEAEELEEAVEPAAVDITDSKE